MELLGASCLRDEECTDYAWIIFADALNKAKDPHATIVDWSFLDEADGQPGEPGDWVKKQVKQLEKWGDDDLHKDILKDMKQRHCWTRNMPQPNISKRYAPNEPPFDPGDILDHTNDDLPPVSLVSLLFAGHCRLKFIHKVK